MMGVVNSNFTDVIDHEMYYSGIGTDEYTIAKGVWKFIPIYSKVAPGETCLISLRSNNLPIWSFTAPASYYYFQTKVFDWTDGLIPNIYIVSDGTATIKISQILTRFQFYLMRVA